MIAVGFAGLTHLGIVSSIVFAAKGFDVVAYDPDAERSTSLSKGVLPIYEPGLGDLLKCSRETISFCSDLKMLRSCKVLFFSADIPTGRDDQSDLSSLLNLIEETLPHVPGDCSVVILSQVPPGFTRRLIDRSGAVCSDRLYYQVETLIFGRAVERALSPERIVVGCSDPSLPLSAPYEQILQAFECPILKMRYESAELTKISINVCLVASISAANTLADLCERLGADWKEIEPALRLDRRIGTHSYIRPGLGIAGGNLERDLVTVKSLCCELGADARVVEAWLANSRYRRDWALRTVQEQVLAQNTDPVIAVWGLAYKPNTASTKNSPALALINSLRTYSIRVYDPKAHFDSSLFPRVLQVKSAIEACERADVLVIMTPWSEFASVEVRDLLNTMPGRIAIDPFGVLDREMWRSNGFVHIELGVPVL